jgi:hypothetical protein
VALDHLASNSNLLRLSFIAPNNYFLRENPSPRISFPNMQLLLSHPKSSSQSIFVCLSQLCFSIQSFSIFHCFSIRLQLKFVKMKSLICEVDVFIRFETVPKDCLLLVVDVSFQSSSDCKNNLCVSSSGTKAANLINHFV